jgi:hypothetical protein
MKDFFISLRAAYQEFVRVYRRRARIKKTRASVTDPFTN